MSTSIASKRTSTRKGALNPDEEGNWRLVRWETPGSAGEAVGHCKIRLTEIDSRSRLPRIQVKSMTCKRPLEGRFCCGVLFRGPRGRCPWQRASLLHRGARSYTFPGHGALRWNHRNTSGSLPRDHHEFSPLPCGLFSACAPGGICRQPLVLSPPPSQMDESRIVIPVVVGSSPISHGRYRCTPCVRTRINFFSSEVGKPKKWCYNSRLADSH